ncbi:MAG: hypothetical protein Q8K67_10385 [Geothrix sp.]|nr:hypothetical protein [Geothrix sp.]
MIIAVPAFAARAFFQDRRTLYQGYEALVGSGVRTPAPQDFDAERHAVSGKLFGHYAKNIRYGVLSLNNYSLKNYGPVHIQLKDIAVKNRVSFLFENSYLLFRQLDVRANMPFPFGYKCSWLNKKELVASKLEPNLLSGSSKTEWGNSLVNNGKTRDEDRCIEAHIYDSFNVDAVQNVEFTDDGTSRHDKLDIKIIKELWSPRKASGWKP